MNEQIRQAALEYADALVARHTMYVTAVKTDDVHDWGATVIQTKVCDELAVKLDTLCMKAAGRA